LSFHILCLFCNNSAAKITKITHTAKEFGGFSLTMMLSFAADILRSGGERFFFALRITGTDTVLKTKLFGLKVRHFNNSCLLIAFTRSIHALFSM
jgi:hypothetical protein